MPVQDTKWWVQMKVQCEKEKIVVQEATRWGSVVLGEMIFWSEVTIPAFELVTGEVETYRSVIRPKVGTEIKPVKKSEFSDR